MMKLPPGFRFHPTDEELLLHYLRRKVLSSPLPASIIPDIDLAKYNPWDLPGGCEQERYFFTVREPKYPNGNRSNRATTRGYWKATGKDRTVSKSNQVIGVKKSLVFYRGKAPNGCRTDWIMHEYRLSNSHSATVIPTKDWVLCRIFTKKRATNVQEQHEDERQHVEFIDFMGRRPSSPSDSESSCVTNESSSNGGGEDTTSSSP